MKVLGKGAFAVGSLELVVACAPTLKETKRDVASIKWDCNPILPIPKEGCYIGGYRSGHFGFDYLRKIAGYSSTIGKQPATWDMSFGKFGAMNDYFPAENCQLLIDMGVIPALKYGLHPFPGFRDVAKGRLDDVIKRFAAGVARSGVPFIFEPFKEMNLNSKDYWNHANEPPAQFVESYRRAHGIFKAEGANPNTVWMPVFVLNCYFYPSGGSPVKFCADPERYYPGDDVVDMIGFVVNNRVMVRERFVHFRNLFRDGYEWARSKHEKKPLAVVEGTQSNNPRQHEYIAQMYQDIPKEFPALKISQWFETLFQYDAANYSWTDDMTFSLNAKSVNAMQEAMRNPYYIGGPLPFLEKYRSTNNRLEHPGTANLTMQNRMAPTYDVSLIPELEARISELARHCLKHPARNAYTCGVELPKGLYASVTVGFPPGATRPSLFLLEIQAQEGHKRTSIETYADGGCDGLGSSGDYYGGPNPQSGLVNENVSLADPERRKQANEQFLKRLYETLSAMQKQYK